MSTSEGAPDVRSLVDQHYELLYRYAVRLSGSRAMAEDLTQETFCTAQEKLGQLRDPSCARAWLCTILRNHYLQEIRRSSDVQVESLQFLAIEPPSESEGPAEIDSEVLQKLLQELPEAFRNPVILFYFEEFSYRQIAEQMGVPIGTVMSRLARAKAFLRSRLKPDYAPHHASTSPGVP